MINILFHVRNILWGALLVVCVRIARIIRGITFRAVFERVPEPLDATCYLAPM